MPGFGWFQLVFADFNRFWPVLAGFGWFWLALARILRRFSRQAAPKPCILRCFGRPAVPKQRILRCFAGRPRQNYVFYDVLAGQLINSCHFGQRVRTLGAPGGGGGEPGTPPRPRKNAFLAQNVVFYMLLADRPARGASSWRKLEGAR